MATFSMERYLSAETEADLALAAEKENGVVREMTAAGVPARLLWSLYLPTDETWFSVFEAPSAESLQEAHERAGIRWARILPATPVQH